MQGEKYLKYQDIYFCMTALIWKVFAVKLLVR